MTDMALAPLHPDEPYPYPDPEGRRPPDRPGPRTVVEGAAPVEDEGLVDDDLVIDPTGPTEAVLAEVIDLHEDDPSLPPELGQPVAGGRSPKARSARRHPHLRTRSSSAPSGDKRATRTPPVIRMGVAWTVVLVTAIVVSPALVAVVLAPVAAIAALSAWKRLETPSADPPWLAPVCAGVAPLAAIAGPVAAGLVVVAGGVVLPLVTARESERAEQIRVALCSLAPAAAAASLVLATRQSVTIGLVLFMAVTLFDASNYVMGVGDTGGRLGALAGVLSLAVLGVVLAGVLVVPFSGSSPWVLCGMIAVACPVAVVAGNRLVGSARLPAWRRLDSLFIAGPLWVILTMVLLQH